MKRKPNQIIVIVCPHRTLRFDIPEWVVEVQTTPCDECKAPPGEER